MLPIFPLSILYVYFQDAISPLFYRCRDFFLQKFSSMVPNKNRSEPARPIRPTVHNQSRRQYSARLNFRNPEVHPLIQNVFTHQASWRQSDGIFELYVRIWCIFWLLPKDNFSSSDENLAFPDWASPSTLRKMKRLRGESHNQCG